MLTRSATFTLYDFLKEDSFLKFNHINNYLKYVVKYWDPIGVVHTLFWDPVGIVPKKYSRIKLVHYLIFTLLPGAKLDFTAFISYNIFCARICTRFIRSNYCEVSYLNYLLFYLENSYALNMNSIKLFIIVSLDINYV